MFNLKSWRWSRLFEPSAWKRVVTHINQIFFILLFIGLLSLALLKNSPEKIFTTEIVGTCTAIIFVFSVLATVCMADEYFEIKINKTGLQKIYLYTSGIYFPNKKIDMTIISRFAGKKYILNEKITEDYHFWKETNCFLCCINDNYYYLSSVFYTLELLGQKKTKTSFMSKDTAQIKVLDRKNVLSIQAEYFILGKIYIPPTAQDKINVHEIKVSAPDEYLIVNRLEKYYVYGLYEDYPRVLLLQIPIIIFKDMGQDVVLVWEEKSGYREIFRTQASVKRSLSNVFVELTDKPKISGIIRRLNEQTMQIETLYEGRFYAIDFDSGSVTGENGFEYNPS